MCSNPKMLARTRWVPCGSCFECRMTKVNDWCTRLLAEAHCNPPCFFLTLTYNEESLPRTEQGKPTFDRYHLKALLREFARDIPNRFRYYAIGEHGTDGERPHYHVLTFGADALYLDSKLQKYWPYGFYTIGEMLGARIMYVSLFHVLKSSHKYPDEFTVMSRRPGIGAEFFERVEKEGRRLKKTLKTDEQIVKTLFYSDDGRIQLGGEVRLLPRYMLDQLDDTIKEKVKDERRRHAYKRFNSFFGLSVDNEYDYQLAWNSLSEEQVNQWKSHLKDTNRRKVEHFKRQHRKSRHVDSPDAMSTD